MPHRTSTLGQTVSRTNLVLAISFCMFVSVGWWIASISDSYHAPAIVIAMAVAVTLQRLLGVRKSWPVHAVVTVMGLAALGAVVPGSTGRLIEIAAWAAGGTQTLAPYLSKSDDKKAG